MHLINQSQAARIAGCSRQNISKMSRNPEQYMFFVKDKRGHKMVNTDDPLWKMYIEEREINDPDMVILKSKAAAGNSKAVTIKSEVDFLIDKNCKPIIEVVKADEVLINGATYCPAIYIDDIFSLVMNALTDRFGEAIAKELQTAMHAEAVGLDNKRGLEDE